MYSYTIYIHSYTVHSVTMMHRHACCVIYSVRDVSGAVARCRTIRVCIAIRVYKASPVSAGCPVPGPALLGGRLGE
jgi:hypothetical protein